jgi:hypothetical protein
MHDELFFVGTYAREAHVKVERIMLVSFVELASFQGLSSMQAPTTVFEMQGCELPTRTNQLVLGDDNFHLAG